MSLLTSSCPEWHPAIALPVADFSNTEIAFYLPQEINGFESQKIVKRIGENMKRSKPQPKMMHYYDKKDEEEIEFHSQHNLREPFCKKQRHEFQ